MVRAAASVIREREGGRWRCDGEEDGVTSDMHPWLWLAFGAAAAAFFASRSLFFIAAASFAAITTIAI